MNLMSYNTPVIKYKSSPLFVQYFCVVYQIIIIIIMHKTYKKRITVYTILNYRKSFRKLST